MSLDHARYVLAGILPDRKDNLLYALHHLSSEHFRQQAMRNLWTAIDQFYDRTAGVIPQHILIDVLERSNVEPARILQYEQMYEDIAALDISDHEFKYAVEGLKDIRAEQMTGEMITTAFEIMERGAEVDGETLEGHRSAREYLNEYNVKIDQLDAAEATPEGDMRFEASEMMEEYLKQKEGGNGRGVLTGIETLDAVTGGFQPGELVLVTAFTGQGKSQISTQTAWHAATQQGLNVFFATTETSRATVRRRIVARHSREAQFGYPGGLNSKHLKQASLDEEGESVYQEVIRDLETNPNYGSLHIAQMPRTSTLSFLASRMQRVQQQRPIDLVVVDYFALFRAERARNSEREEFNEILRGAKVLATSFADGAGVPLVSPWQLSRSAYADAVRSGAYGLSSLSDTSEAEKVSDLIISMLRPEETPEEVIMQILKNRDGETPKPMTLEVDYRTSYLADRGDGGGAYDLGDFIN